MRGLRARHEHVQWGSLDAVERTIAEQICSRLVYTKDHPLKVKAGELYVRTTMASWPRGRWIHVGNCEAIWDVASRRGVK